MIRLTRFRKNEPLYLNPDHIERLDHNHETIVHLANGNEYVVMETPDQIVDLIVALRARVIAMSHHGGGDLFAVSDAPTKSQEP